MSKIPGGKWIFIQELLFSQSVSTMCEKGFSPPNEEKRTLKNVHTSKYQAEIQTLLIKFDSVYTCFNSNHLYTTFSSKMINLLMHVALANSRIVFLQLWSHQSTHSYDFSFFCQYFSIRFVFLTFSAVIPSLLYFLPISLSFPSPLLSSLCTVVI